MAISTDYDYEHLLAFDNAKLGGCERPNHLGTRRLIVIYNLQTSGVKEDAAEWLETNRSTVTDPQFSFKVYEGAWRSVSIEYDEDRKAIIQTFLIDSEMINDVSSRSHAGVAWKNYYWRVADPREYNIPTYTSEDEILDGLVWYAAHGENAGKPVYHDNTETYGLWWDGSVNVVSLIADIGGTPTNYYSSSDIEGVYAASGSWTGTPTIGWDDGYEWSKTCNDNGDGTYDVVITKSERTSQTGTSTVRAWGESGSQSTSPSTDIIVSGADESECNQEYELTSGSWEDDTGVWTGKTDSTCTIYSWNNGTTWKWYLDSDGTIVANRPYYNLNSSEWYTANNTPSLSDFYLSLIVQIGKNPPPSVQTTTVYTSAGEEAFVTDGGTVADPVAGEEKSINNLPVENGEFRVTISSTKVNMQRIPALLDSIVYASGGDADKGSFINARNATYEQLQKDINWMRAYKAALQNAVSSSVNRFGLYDYTIRSVQV